MTRETIKEQAELLGINVVVKRYRPHRNLFDY